MTDASEVFDDWVKSLAEQQDKRKASLEDRALGVVKNAAALVGLLLALIAVITDDKGFELPVAAKAALSAGVVLFTASGVVAIITNAPRADYKRVKPENIANEVETRWNKTSDIAHRMVIRTRLDLLVADSKANDAKAKHLAYAIGLEVAGVAAVAVAVISILIA